MKVTVDLSAWRTMLDRLVAALERLLAALKRFRDKGKDQSKDTDEEEVTRRVYTDEEFADKVDYEGGVFSALQYGMRAADLANQTSLLAERWRKLEEWYQAGRDLVDLVQQSLDDAWGTD